MPSKRPILFVAAATAFLLGAASLLAGEAIPPQRPFPSVLLEPVPDPGLRMHAAPPLAPLDFTGALNILVNQDNTVQLQNEEQIVTNPTDPDNIVAVWRDFRLGYRRVAYSATFDGGITWTEDLFEEYTYPWHSDPGLTVDAEGNFFAVILSYTSTYEPNGLFVYKSTDGGLSWGEPVTVVNGVPGVFEDKELIACDRTGGAYDGNLYVTWARFGYDVDIMLSRSTNGGASFTAPITVSDVATLQWPVPVVGADGAVYIAWVHYYPTSIRFDKSVNGGATFGTDRTLASVSFGSGYLNGGIWAYSYPAMDADITTTSPHYGNLYVAYMDYGVGYDTDIFFRRSTNAGITWSGAQRLNDDAQGNGRDQFHPWLTVDESGGVYVVFLDRRNDPSNYLYDCYVTHSTDGGLTWSENMRVSDVSSDPQAGQMLAGLLGEYIGATSSGGRVNVLWTDTRRGHQDAFTARIYTAPDVDARLTTAPGVLHPGDDLSYTVHVANTTGEQIGFTGAGYATLPWGDPMGFGPVDGPVNAGLGPFQERSVAITHRLPLGTPPGRYYYTLRLWQSPDIVMDEETFPFTVELP